MGTLLLLEMMRVVLRKWRHETVLDEKMVMSRLNKTLLNQ